MLGWRTAAIALAIAIFAMCAGTPVFAGDTTVAVQRLGPPAVEARREALLQQMIASPSDLVWIGFSYAAFRLLSTLRDRQTGELPILSLREFITYTLFFPAYIAGPIDRAERFLGDLRGVRAGGWGSGKSSALG